MWQTTMNEQLRMNGLRILENTTCQYEAYKFNLVVFIHHFQENMN